MNHILVFTDFLNKIFYEVHKKDKLFSDLIHEGYIYFYVSQA